jgi:ketosteroid isomerase-like protein
MKKTIIAIILISAVFSCKQSADTESIKKEVYQTEKAFEKMASEKGMAEAFFFFASDEAVIRRGNDSLIKGKENIKNYYARNSNPEASLNWTPDFIGVSDCGTLAYTYGKYVYSVKDSTGAVNEHSGIFHTVWKKENNEWRYVWD